MPLNIRDEQVNQLANQVAARRRVSKTEAVRLALQRDLAALDRDTPMMERIREIQARVASWPDTGLEADKAFYDSLNDE